MYGVKVESINLQQVAYIASRPSPAFYYIRRDSCVPQLEKPDMGTWRINKQAHSLEHASMRARVDVPWWFTYHIRP